MDEPLFKPECTYTRREIFDALGGDLVSNFPRREGQVLYCCIAWDHNPDAPDVILVSTKEQMAKTAKHFAKQSKPVPVFVKLKGRRNSALVYQGIFVVDRYSEDRGELAYFAKKAWRVDVAGLLFLTRISWDYDLTVTEKDIV